MHRERRSAGGAQVDPARDGAADADRAARDVRDPHLRHHRPRVLFGRVPQRVLPRQR